MAISLGHRTRRTAKVFANSRAWRKSNQQQILNQLQFGL